MYTWSYVPEGTSPARLLALNALVNASACSSCIHLPKPDPTPFAATSLRRARQLGDGERAWHIAGVVPANEHESLGPPRPEEEGTTRET